MQSHAISVLQRPLKGEEPEYHGLPHCLAMNKYLGLAEGT